METQQNCYFYRDCKKKGTFLLSELAQIWLCEFHNKCGAKGCQSHTAIIPLPDSYARTLCNFHYNKLRGFSNGDPNSIDRARFESENKGSMWRK